MEYKKQIFFDKLPHNKSFINWVESVGLNVPFVCGEVEGNIKILSYDQINQKIELQYNDNIKIMLCSDFRKGYIGKLIGVRKGKEINNNKIKNTRIKNTNSNIRKEYKGSVISTKVDLTKSIDLSDIPKINNRCDWKNAIGRFFYFKYYDIEGRMEVLDYNTPFITLKYNNKIDTLHASNIGKCAISKFLDIEIRQIGETFSEWCIRNDRKDLLELWDYDLNTKLPNNVGAKSDNEFYFKCPRNIHKSNKRRLVTIVDGNIINPCKECNSFGQWCIDNDKLELLDRWDYELNDNTPFDYALTSLKKCYFKCPKNLHESHHFILGNIVHRNVPCECPHCVSIGFLYPQSLLLWSDKNNCSPLDCNYKSNKKVWFKCENNLHNDYQRNIRKGIDSEFRCPQCVAEQKHSSLQSKLTKYIQYKYNYYLLHEYECTIIPKNPKTNHNLPFDNEIKELKLIIEVHGHQHYEIDGFHYMNAKHYNITPEQSLKQRKLYDRYKKAVAECDGYFYLEIPYWTEKDETYKTLIDDKIFEIINNGGFRDYA